MAYESMEESAFRQSYFGQASEGWLDFMLHAIAIHRPLYGGIQVMGAITRAISIVGNLTRQLTEGQKEQVDGIRQVLNRESESDYGMINVLVLMGAWAALESFVEDSCKAAIMDQGIREFDALLRIDLPERLLRKDLKDQVDYKFGEALRVANSNRKGRSLTCAIKFETMLSIIDLADEGDIGEELREALQYAQQSRNAWAHRAGRVDKLFLKYCPDKGLNLGDKIVINSGDNTVNLYAILAYGMFIINRYRKKVALAPMPFPGNRSAPFAEQCIRLWGQP